MPTPTSETPLEIFHRGVPLNAGPCPTLLYLAVGGRDSLHTEPFCQPVDYFLSGSNRAISVDLPFHGEGYDNHTAMNLWALSIAAEDDFFERFLNGIADLLNNLKDNEIIDPAHFSIAGLSRGGFIASHIAAKIPWIKNLLAFAPLTLLNHLAEFENLAEHHLVKKWSLLRHTEELAHKRIRYYIGNLDTRVDTDSCYTLLRAIVRKGKLLGLRTCNVEMVMTPSVGHKGHGTLPHIFEEGIVWLKNYLE